MLAPGKESLIFHYYIKIYIQIVVVVKIGSLQRTKLAHLNSLSTQIFGLQ